MNNLRILNLKIDIVLLSRPISNPLSTLKSKTSTPIAQTCQPSEALQPVAAQLSLCIVTLFTSPPFYVLSSNLHLYFFFWLVFYPIWSLSITFTVYDDITIYVTIYNVYHNFFLYILGASSMNSKAVPPLIRIIYLRRIRTSMDGGQMWYYPPGDRRSRNNSVSHRQISTTLQLSRVRERRLDKNTVTDGLHT